MHKKRRQMIGKSIEKDSYLSENVGCEGTQWMRWLSWESSRQRSIIEDLLKDSEIVTTIYDHGVEDKTQPRRYGTCWLKGARNQGGDSAQDKG